MAVKIVSVSSLKKGSYIIIDGAACKVTDLKISRPGKHGHAKVNLTAVGIFFLNPIFQFFIISSSKQNKYLMQSSAN